MAKIIRIDADAVAADQPGLERRKFHFVCAAASTSHIDTPMPGEDLRDLVHEGDVDVALGILDTFAASAALIDAARNTPPLVIAP